MVSRVCLGLEAVSEYTQLDKITNAVIQRLNVRTMQSRDSSTNVLLATTPEFVPDAKLYDVTSLIGNAQVCWLESKWNLIDQIEQWNPVRIVPLIQLSDYENMGAFAASFYMEEPNSPTDNTTSYVQFSFLPAKACRIRFNRNIVRMELDATSLLPDSLSELIVLEAQNSIISRIKLSLTMGLRRDEAGRADAKAILEVLSEVYAQNMMDIHPLELLWKTWAYRDKNEPTSFTKPTPGGRQLYSDGQFGYGYGGFGNGY